MNCVGLDLCSKKNCLEQERCVFNISHPVQYPLKRGSKKKKHTTKEPRVELCQTNIKFCTNQRACEILGQCILDHPLVKADKLATKQLRKPHQLSEIIRIITRLMPSLKRIGTKRYDENYK